MTMAEYNMIGDEMAQLRKEREDLLELNAELLRVLENARAAIDPRKQYWDGSKLVYFVDEIDIAITRESFIRGKRIQELIPVYRET